MTIPTYDQRVKDVLAWIRLTQQQPGGTGAPEGYCEMHEYHVWEVLNALDKMQPPIMDEDTFFTKFEPLDSPEGSMMWEREQVMPLIEAGEITDNNVWTAVDTDGGIAYVAGWQMVNRFAYLVTKVPWVNELETCEIPDEEEE